MKRSGSTGGVRNKQMLIINFSYPRERGDCRICDEISHEERTYGVHMIQEVVKRSGYEVHPERSGREAHLWRRN